MVYNAGGGIVMKPSSRMSPIIRTVTAALLLMLSLGTLTSCKPKYATDYYDGLNEVGPEIKDEWNVRKDTKQDVTRLIVTHDDDLNRVEYIDYLHFDVFDNAHLREKLSSLGHLNDTFFDNFISGKICYIFTIKKHLAIFYIVEL